MNEEGSDPFDGIEIADSKGDEALIVPTDTINYAEELASFAVQACNVHDDLLAACKLVKADLETMRNNRGFPAEQKYYEQVQKVLTKVIVKAEGE